MPRGGQDDRAPAGTYVTAKELLMINPLRMTEFSVQWLAHLLWRMRVWIATIAIMLVVVAATVATTVSGFGCPPPKEEARIQMDHIKQSLDMYYTRSSPNQYPDRLDQLVERNIWREIPLDPWENPYVYVRTSKNTYALFSAGPDGTAATGDDIHLRPIGEEE
jgi:general secretion pathway protein G